MTIDTCVVVLKQTALALGGRAARMARRGDATGRRIVRADETHRRTVDAVRAALARRGIAAVELTLSTVGPRERRILAAGDLVIGVGGDGTALGAAHHVRAGALLGVNSAPRDSIGHFCRSTGPAFARHLDEILAGGWRPTALARLATVLDGRPLPELALNDVLVTHDCAAATSRYLIRLGAREEEHRSSGIWIATAAGSTGGIRSAGGRPMPRRSRRLQYLVRELYREPGRRYRLTRGFIDPGRELAVASKMPAAHLYIDGARTAYAFRFGARARFRVAAENLRIFL